jgi:hypothetical protein
MNPYNLTDNAFGSGSMVEFLAKNVLKKISLFSFESLGTFFRILEAALGAWAII